MLEICKLAFEVSDFSFKASDLSFEAVDFAGDTVDLADNVINFAGRLAEISNLGVEILYARLKFLLQFVDLRPPELKNRAPSTRPRSPTITNPIFPFRKSMLCTPNLLIR